MNKKQLIVSWMAAICFITLTVFAQEPQAILTHCPDCNAELNKVPIIYGEPTRKAMTEATEGKIVLGGCFVYEGQPNYAFICPKCKEIIGRYLIEEPPKVE